MSSAFQQNSITSNSTKSSVAVPIPKTPDYVELLNALVHSQEVLASAGYTVTRLSSEELQGKKRCSGCGKQILQRQKNENNKNKNKNNKRQKENNDNNDKKNQKDALGEKSLDKNCIDSIPSSPGDTTSDGPPSNGVVLPDNEPRMRCKYHSGHLKSKTWSCCGKPSTDPPCVQHEFHIPRFYVPGEIERLWQHHPTNLHKTQSSHRTAVAIDCEMGTSVSNDSEIIRVTLLDYFSGQVLIDKLVWPDVPMLHLNTRYSGIRWVDLNNARRKHKCLYGKDNARAAVLKFVGPSTIVVGHSAQNDLKSLRWIHHRILDTHILEFALIEAEHKEAEQKEAKQQAANESPQEAPSESTTVPDTNPKNTDGSQKKRGKGRGLLSLKTLSKVKLGREIQVGRNGHDSIEDALAARDLVHVYLTSEDNRAVRDSDI